MAQDHTRPSKETRDSERKQAKANHIAGDGPTPEEEAAADETVNLLDDEVRENYKHALETGAHAKGEGRID